MTVADTTHRMGCYGWSTGQGGVHHHRIAEPLRVLADRGYRAWSGDILTRSVLEQCDTVLMHQGHSEAVTEAWHELDRHQTHRMIMDVDDAMWTPDWEPFKRAYTPDAIGRLLSNVERSHVVTTPSPVIADYLSKYNDNVWVVPNTVPAWLTEWQMPPRPRPVVGYQGSPHHIRDWTLSDAKHLSRFLASFRGWDMRVYGSSVAHWEKAFPGRVHSAPWAGSVTDYYKTVSMDVGIGPLRDTPFNRSKSDLRAREYGALGIVAVLPSTPPIYTSTVIDGVTGWLVKTHETLSTVLRRAALDPDHLDAMSRTARERARLHWTTEGQIERWIEAWDSPL